MAAKEYYVCPICRHKNEDTKKYCDKCGTWLLSETFPAIKYRRKSGTALRRIWKVIGYTTVLLLLIFGALVYWGSTLDTPEQVTAIPEDEYKASAVEIDYETLARNPEQMKGQRVKLSGKVFQVFESGRSTQIHLHMNRAEFGWRDSVYVFYDRPKGADRILEDDMITIWGDVKGLQTLQTILGSEITVPSVTARYVEIEP